MRAQAIEALSRQFQRSPRLGVATHTPQPHALCQSDSGVIEGKLGDAGVGQRGPVELFGFGISGCHRRDRQGQGRRPRRHPGQIQQHRLGGQRAGLLEAPGVQCGLDGVEHILGQLVFTGVQRRPGRVVQAVTGPVPRRADCDRGLIGRVVVRFCQGDPHRDPVRGVEESLQGPRRRPGANFGAVAAGGLQLTPSGGEHPEVGE